MFHAGLQTSYDTLRAVDVEMDRLLNETYADVKAMLERNRDAYDALIHALTTGDDQTLSGEQVRPLFAFLNVSISIDFGAFQPQCLIT